MRVFIISLISLFFISLSTNIQAQNPDSTSGTKVFELGEVNIVSQRVASTVSPQKALAQNKQEIAGALENLPSVWFVNYGSRNESSVHLRGFDTRGIPLYIDGVPVYIPYDGLIDLARFKTFGYSRIDVSQGLSPMAFGPNTLGGAINLVTLKPQKKLEAQAMLGAFSGKGYQYGLGIGSRMGKWYFQANYFHTQQDFLPLSNDYVAGMQEDGDKRENSYSSDDNLNLKIGFTPNEKSEYAISLSHQEGEKGNPPYSGNDPLNRARFWQWPTWDKTSVYFLSNNQIGDKSKLKLRIFYDKFANKLESFDDSTYSSQNRGYAFTSIYDDYDLGGNLVLELAHIKNNKMSLSAHFKNDNHSEHNVGEQVRNTSDNTFSLGFDDIYTLNKKNMVIAGLSYNIRNSVLAEDYFASNDSIGQFAPYTGNALNGQIALKHFFSKQFNLQVSFAHKTRFSTMKERYSYKMGRGIPNPELKAEQASHYDIQAQYQLRKWLKIQASAYYIHLNDVIQSVDEVQPGMSQMQNTGTAEFQGFDLSSSILAHKNLQIQLSYSFIDRKNISLPQLYFTDIPEHKLFGQLEWKIFKDLQFNLTSTYYSDRYSTSYGTVADAFMVVSTSLSYLWKNLQFNGGINNLLDKNYAYTEGFPAPGRNFYFNVIYRFENK
jgi:iron complex outermembrane receptor protein